ncbi:MAG: hypothetical protein WAO51_11520, partial [Bacillota bacterium]
FLLESPGGACSIIKVLAPPVAPGETAKLPMAKSYVRVVGIVCSVQPGDSECEFRSNPNTDFSLIRTLISI